jgi:uncharacterized membrane-anchored protein
MGLDGDGRRAVGTLVRDLVEESTTLVRSEARLAKLELSRAATAIGRGSALVALGSVLLLLGTLALVIGVILLIGDQWLPADRYWLAALIVVAITGLVAALLAKRGFARLALARLGPAETATSLKENATWVKQQLTSGERSK